jgi:hypothetical protein
MAKAKDINDVLREEGEDAARAFHDRQPFTEDENPRKANGGRTR